VYRAFARTPEGLAFAKTTYAKAKSGYHPMTQQAVEGILAGKSKKH
jgi:leukotriene-A4 hydrolase